MNADERNDAIDTAIDELVNITSGWLRSGAIATSSALNAAAEGLRTTGAALDRLGASLEDSSE